MTIIQNEKRKLTNQEVKELASSLKNGKELAEASLNLLYITRGNDKRSLFIRYLPSELKGKSVCYKCMDIIAEPTLLEHYTNFH